MKNLYKQCKSTRQVNQYLKSIGLADFEFDADYNFPEEFDWDGWTGEDEAKGVSLQVTTSFEVFVSKYTRKDIEQMEKEYNL